jgi:polysaccharide biosynthesis transport protein
MSRDFELLQLVEQERNRRSRSSAVISETIHAAGQEDASGIAQEQVESATQPAAYLAAAVRDELTKLILRTFLSTSEVKVVMFTGVEAQEGAKWIAACTADVLSRAIRGKVCLLDADLAYPTLHRYFSIPNQNGLAAILSGSRSVEGATIRVGENLWIVPAGTAQGPSQMTTTMFQATVVDLLYRFDYIVISAPDYERYTEVSVIGAATEGAVLVLDAMLTRRVPAQDAKLALEAAKIRILGCVFNNRSFPVPDFLYSRL